MHVPHPAILLGSKRLSDSKERKLMTVLSSVWTVGHSSLVRSDRSGKPAYHPLAAAVAPSRLSFPFSETVFGESADRSSRVVSLAR